MSDIKRVGILHPGAMGISVAATIKNSGFDVYWVSEGRSNESHQRAAEHDLKDAGSLATLCATCQAIVSVCPPHAAEEVAQSVVDHDFSGVYIDANAISPQKTSRIDDLLSAAGVNFVDGGIIGGPAWQPGRTWLSLSGPQANLAASLFAAGPLEVDVIGDDIGKASALKMVYAANTKGSTALLCAVLGAAEALGVRGELERQWSRYDENEPEQSQQRLRRVTAKAWRFAGEMEEIAETFGLAGLPEGFHKAAHEVYARLADFKDAPELPSLEDVLAALTARRE
ncbi:MAG: DUF1932 domain-containing protein [Chloroflexi bacterium]|nr:DUF1932 domain-containing protein [Chloroflexota bacterium]